MSTVIKNLQDMKYITITRKAFPIICLKIFNYPFHICKTDSINPWIIFNFFLYLIRIRGIVADQILEMMEVIRAYLGELDGHEFPVVTHRLTLNVN